MINNNAYIGTTRYVKSKSELTQFFGYNGDTAYIINDSNKVEAQYTKIDGEWKFIHNNIEESFEVTLPDDYITIDVDNLVNYYNKEEIDTKLNKEKEETENKINDLNKSIENLKTVKKYELIETISVTEENTTSITRTTEPDGTEYNFEKILIKMHLLASESTDTIAIRLNNISSSIFVINIRTVECYPIAYGHIENGMFIGQYTGTGATTVTASATLNNAYSRIGIFIDNISKIAFKTNSGIPIPVGSTFEIYAVRL